MPIATVCKLLTYKGQYSPCQIKVPDVTAPLAAVEIDQGYYSLFRRFDCADTVIDALKKLAPNGDKLALTKVGGGYVVWAQEPQAQAITSARKQARKFPTHGPANCWLLGEAKQYPQCYIQVPELAEPLVAIGYGERFYSVFQANLTADQALTLSAQFGRRGNEVAIASTAKGYAVCLWEPEATAHTPSHSASTETTRKGKSPQG